MKIIIGALVLYAAGFIIGMVISSVSDAILCGKDEQKTWERIERWRN